jgi:hypothetical protein
MPGEDNTGLEWGKGNTQAPEELPAEDSGTGSWLTKGEDVSSEDGEGGEHMDCMTLENPSTGAGIPPGMWALPSVAEVEEGREQEDELAGNMESDTSSGAASSHAVTEQNKEAAGGDTAAADSKVAARGEPLIGIPEEGQQAAAGGQEPNATEATLSGPWVNAILGINGLLDLPPNFGYSFIISLEGNIGAGKSTLLRMAEPSLRACGYEVAYERAEFMPDLLAAFYKSPKTYAATLQAAIMMAYHGLVQANCPKVLIVERSPVSSLQVFA